MTQRGIELRSPRSLANTLPTRPMYRLRTLFQLILWSRLHVYPVNWENNFRYIFMHFAPYLFISPKPLRFYSQGFKLLPVSLVTRLYRLRLEWIRLLTEEEVPEFISQSRNYSVILFTYAVFNHSFRSSCVCFHWPHLRKSFKLYNPNRFHVIYFFSLH